jgi:hypothetical protein
MSAIHWFENPAFDAPEMKSPQPCIHGAGCVYTKKTADGKVVPGVCSFVHPGEEGKGRALFPERTIRDTLHDGNGKMVQPACVRLIGNAGYYERMRLRMPWQAWCASKGIPFTANVPGVFRQPVQRIPIGGPKPAGGMSRASFQSPPPPRRSMALPIRHMRTIEDQDFLITADRVTLLKPEEAVRFGLRPAPPSAVPTADQSWPVLGGTAEARRAAAAAVVRLEVVEGEVVVTPHPVVEQEVIAASAAGASPAWRSSEGLIDDEEEDTCGYCQRIVDQCREHGDHSEEIREMAAAAAW